MWLKRLVWLGLMLLAGIMFVFENSPAAFGVLLSVVLAPLASILLTALTRKKVVMQLMLDKTAVKHKTIDGMLRITNTGILPATVYGSLEWRNLRTNEVSVKQKAIFVWGRKSNDTPLDLSSSHCGKLTVNFREIYLSDVFGLTKYRLPDAEEGSSVIYPDCFPLELKLSGNGMSMMDSDRYSQDKPGNDPGETFAVREYVPGDMIKQIHWKLSQKTDKLMVREFGLPIVHQVVLLMETGTMGQAPQIIDDVTEMTASLGMALANSTESFSLAWNEPHTDALIIRDVENEIDLSVALEEILSLQTTASGATVTECFSREMPHCTYAHALVVSPAMQSMIRELYSGNRVTQLLPQDCTDGLQPDGTYLVSCGSKDHLKMYQIEV